MGIRFLRRRVFCVGGGGVLSVVCREASSGLQGESTSKSLRSTISGFPDNEGDFVEEFVMVLMLLTVIQLGRSTPCEGEQGSKMGTGTGLGRRARNGLVVLAARLLQAPSRRVGRTVGEPERGSYEETN